MEGAVIPRLPEGLVARPLTWDDVDGIFRLEHACEAFDDGEAEIALSDVEAEWRRRNRCLWCYVDRQPEMSCQGETVTVTRYAA
jgi:hypothetical protein